MGRGPANGVGGARVDRVARPRAASRPRLELTARPFRRRDRAGPRPQHRCRRRRRRLGAGVGGRRTRRPRAANGDRPSFVGRRSKGRGRSPTPSPPTSTSCSSAIRSPWRRTSVASNASSCSHSTAEPTRWSCSPRATSSTTRSRPGASCRRSPSACPCSCPAVAPTAGSTSCAGCSVRDERWRSSAPAASASRRSSTPCSASSARRRPRCAAITAAATPPSPPSSSPCPTTAAG